MNIIFTIIAAPLIGWFVRPRGMAVVGYLAAESLLFAYQCLAVLLAWMAGEGGFGGAAEQGAFGPAPTGFPLSYAESGFWAYGLVNGVIILAGLGLLLLFGALRSRRLARRQVV